MKCTRCSEKAVYPKPTYCKEHFCAYFEKKVKDTIRKYRLIHKKDKILVGISGGKDSLTVLHLLHTLGYPVEALAIDEGIAGYRDKTLVDAKRFCAERQIPLRIVRYKDEFGTTLDHIMKKRGKNACSPCGAFRRHTLNKYSHSYDKLVTGHNMDDEAQTVLLNLFKNHTALLPRQGPATAKKPGFVPRVKPLYFLKEKEVMTYSYLNGIQTTFTECPYSKAAYRIHLRDQLNAYEETHPDTKENLVRHHLLIKKKIRTTPQAMNYCTRCGAPAAKTLCQSCTYTKLSRTADHRPTPTETTTTS